MTEITRTNIQRLIHADGLPETRIAPYRYRVLSGVELAKEPALLQSIEDMLIAQPAERLHARFGHDQFKFHHDEHIVKPERREQWTRRYGKVKGETIKRHLDRFASEETHCIVVVYDAEGKLAVVSDARWRDKEALAGELITGTIRAVDTRSSPGVQSLTDFARDQLIEASLEDPAVEVISAYVNRKNKRSREKSFALLERFERRGLRVSMRDGIVQDKVVISKQWRAYQIRRPQSMSEMEVR